MTDPSTCPDCAAELIRRGVDLFCRRCRCPVLPGRPDGTHVRVWCRHCRRDHRHVRCQAQCDGICTCPAGSGSGHRAAQCANRNPYRIRGYVIAEIVSDQPPLFT